jgi:hypothetical protein
MDRASDTADTATTDGTITMDLRFVVFNLIDSDLLLRSLLANYADHLEHGHAPNDVGTATAFLALKWTDERTSTPAGSEFLTAQAHISRNDPSGHEYLDFVLKRLRGALAADAASRSITSRCLRTSEECVENGLDTVFKTSTWEIAPAPSQPEGAAPTRLAPWPGCVQVGAACLIAPGVGALSMN